MNQKNPNLLFAESEAFDVRGKEIYQQNTTQQIPAGENGNPPIRSFGRPVNQQAAEIPVLRDVKALVDLRQRADEHEQQSQAEAHDREAQRGKETDDSINHLDILQSEQTL